MLLDKLTDRHGYAKTSGIGGLTREKVPMAVTFFLVYAATLDGSYDSSERKRIKAILEKRFQLSTIQANRLIVEAEDPEYEDNSPESHAQALTNAFSEQDRAGLMDMLWDVVYADGVVDEREIRLMGTMQSLLSLDDAVAEQCRVNAAHRYGQ